MIIDTHTSIPPEFLRPRLDKLFEKATVEGLLSRMEKAGIDLAVVWSIARNPDEVSRINDWISSLCEKYPDKFVGFANVYPPRVKESLKEIDRAVDKLRLIGIKFHPEVQKFRLDDPSVLKILKRAKEYALPVVTHVASPAYDPVPLDKAKIMQEEADRKEPFAKASYLAKIIRAYDDPKFFAAHMGGLYVEEIRRSNISFQTTGVCKEAIEYGVENVGAERIVYGSDFPFFEVIDEVEKVKEAKILKEDKEKILGENFRKVLEAKV
ncbi:MAG: amidohydrolase family protein [Candidatus Bathyarchaeia archaeon]